MEKTIKNKKTLAEQLREARENKPFTDIVRKIRKLNGEGKNELAILNSKVDFNVRMRLESEGLTSYVKNVGTVPVLYFVWK